VFFVNLLGVAVSNNLLGVANYKIEIKNDSRVKCDFDVAIGFPNFENFGVG